MDKKIKTTTKSENKTSIFSYFIKRPVLAWVINISIMLVGVVSWQKLDVRELPKINFPVVSVRTEYSGAGSEIVESQVTIPLEEALAGIEGLDFMQSSSSNGQSLITLNFTTDTNPDGAATNVRAAVAKTKDSLPQNLRDPVVSKSSTTEKELIRLAAHSEKYNLAEIADYLHRFAKGQIESISGVAAVHVYGGGGGGDSGSFQIHAIVSPEKMHAMDVTVKEIREAIFQQSFKKPLGEINQNDISYTATLDQAATSVEDYSSIVLKSNKLGFVKLSDVASVQFITDDIDTKSRYNGKPCVTLSIIPQQTANPIKIARNAREKLEEIRKSLPKNLTVEISSDASEAINKSINEVYSAIFEAILFVFLIIFLFLKSWKSTIIPMITVPICIFGGFFIIYTLNYTINTLTLLAIVLAIGLVVDDAIVVLENIYRHIEKGKSPFKASVEGIKEIEFSVIAMTLTLMAVYTPITLASGMVGKMFTEFAVTLAGTVLISGVVALVLTPMLCSRMLNNDISIYKNKKFQKFTQTIDQKIDSALNAIDTSYKKYLALAMQETRTVMFLAAIFGAISASVAFFYLPKTLMPEIDTGYIVLSLEGPSGATANYSNTYASKLEPLIQKIPSLKNYLLSIQSRSGKNSIQIKLEDLEKRKQSSKEVLEDLEKKVNMLQSGLRVRGYCWSGSLGGSGDSAKTVSFALQSQKTYKEMQPIINQVMSLLRSHPSVNQQSMRATRAHPEKSYKVKINQEKSAQLNVRPQEIGEMLSFIWRGQPPADRFVKDNRRYPMRVMVNEEMKKNPENFKKFHIRAYKTDNREKQPPLVSLHELIEVKEDEEIPINMRYEGMRSYEITFEIFESSPVNFYQEISPALSEILPTGYKHSPTGEIHKTLKEGQNVTLVFILAILFIFLILAAQFESFVDPLIIMLSVPLALGGGVLILTVLPNSSLNIYTYIALITLIGLITKHGILIVDFANKKLEILQEKGKILTQTDIASSVKEASLLRLRPILMTTAAMVLGSVPLALSKSSGFEIRSQIGWVVIAGMLIGTLFTIFVIPSFYQFVKTYTLNVKRKSS